METQQQLEFDLGWDFAAFNRDVPEDAPKSFCDGYRAFGQGVSRTVHNPDRYVRKWLQIRYGAIRRGKYFSPDVDAQYLEKITPASMRCPVTGERFTVGKDKATDWSVDRANNERGYVRGNIIIINVRANQAKGDKSLEDIFQLASLDHDQDGLLPEEWGRLARLVEPAFGEHDDASPVPILLGQPVALGMPVSPIAGFQVALSRALISGWDKEQREFATAYVIQMRKFVCRTKAQRRAFDKLMDEVIRRTRHISSYTEVWATPRIQKRLWRFVNTLGAAGLGRLVDLQEYTVGEQNTKIV